MQHLFFHTFKQHCRRICICIFKNENLCYVQFLSPYGRNISPGSRRMRHPINICCCSWCNVLSVHNVGDHLLTSLDKMLLCSWYLINKLETGVISHQYLPLWSTASSTCTLNTLSVANATLFSTQKSHFSVQFGLIRKSRWMQVN